MKIVTPHTEEEIVKFSEIAGISLKHARYIEYMRDTYIQWEHEYVKNPECKKKYA